MFLERYKNLRLGAAAIFAPFADYGSKPELGFISF